MPHSMRPARSRPGSWRCSALATGAPPHRLRGVNSPVVDLQPLSALLRSRTKEAHTAAERSGVMSSLLRGHVTRERYALLLRNLHPLYDALERALDRVRDDPWLQPIHDPRLWRTAPLERDLVHLAGPAWAALPVTATAAAYAQRIDGLHHDHPGQLVAHAYVRYLGDLNGG